MSVSTINYKNTKLKGPFIKNGFSYYQIIMKDINFPGPLANDRGWALVKAKEIVDEALTYVRNPRFISGKPYNQYSLCPNCGKGNRNDRLKCWNCGFALVELEKPHFGPPSGVFKRPKPVKKKAKRIRRKKSKRN